MTKIDFDQLRREIRQLDRHQPLYKLLKEELDRLGHWKQQPRGKPFSDDGNNPFRWAKGKK